MPQEIILIDLSKDNWNQWAYNFLRPIEMPEEDYIQMIFRLGLLQLHKQKAEYELNRLRDYGTNKEPENNKP